MFLLILKLLGVLTGGILLRFGYLYVYSKEEFDMEQHLKEAGLAFATAIPISALVACSLTYWWVAGFALLALGFLSKKYQEKLNKKRA
jgi:hypothetical protein